MTKFIWVLCVGFPIVCGFGTVAAQQADQQGGDGSTPKVQAVPPPASDKASPAEKIAPPLSASQDPANGKLDKQKDTPRPMQKSDVITPPPTGDAAIQHAAPNSGADSMPIIRPPSAATTPQ